MGTMAGPLAAVLLAYLLGSIPFGIILTRLFGAGDLRKVGSGNIGATNVLRTGRKGLAAATLILDGLKGTAAVILCERLFPGTAGLAAIFALLGHLYPVWLKFAGGKGVATLFGILIGFSVAGDLHWAAPLAYAAAWLGLLLLIRYSSVAGMSAALVTPVVAAILGRFDLALLFLGLGLVVLWKHRGNLERLLSGTEPRIGAANNG
ncbi:MAG TPA: glycerol-3-phosphate 1-O-acyltransferase PlsY [Allosphingosinicella sp.]|jgi:glycerol-3-phosphate acyltransferase PlsY